jgi:CRISPR type IV-associated protein Csf2
MRRKTKMKRINGRLEGILTLLSPLSHIGESTGPDSYLATQEIIGADGLPVEVFCYSGNAARGMFRDAGAKYFLNKLAGQDSFMKIPLEIFYLLFSGGAIGGEQKIDIDQARKIREAIPVLSIFGGGVGNQILAGKMNVNDAWPICHECRHLIPEQYRQESLISWRQMTTERSYTRTDDAKDERLRPYLQTEEKLMIEGNDGQMTLIGGGEEKKDKKKKKEAPQQMRYTIEVLQAGSKLWHRIDVKDMTEIEFGALVSCFVEWSKNPYIGGQSRIGMGRVHTDYKWIPEEGEEEDFILIGDTPLLGKTAQEAKQRYDDYLNQYTQYLEENKQRLVSLIEA